MDIRELEGRIIAKINGAEKFSDLIVFACSDGSRFKMYHQQDCCESVSLEDVVGDVSDLLDNPVISAYESTSDDPASPEEDGDRCGSHTWTFYRIATIKGTVTFRWYGSSNGYYSESAYFDRIEE